MKNRKICVENLFALFRCKPNSKIPLDKHGFHDAKFNSNLEYLMRNNCNIGIACAQSGIIVLDLDVDSKKGLNGINNLKELEKSLGILPKTLTQTTPRGGKHLIFSSKGVTNPIGKIGKSIDLKFNGYILSEPSCINGKSYKFTDGFDDKGNVIIAELPLNWLGFINKALSQQILVQKFTNQHNERKIIDGDFQKIYDNCSFIKNCVDNAEFLSEIEWFYFACILNSLSNGESLFDVFSRPHKDYDPILVSKKFQNAKKYNVNCKTISKICCECINCKGGNNVSK